MLEVKYIHTLTLSGAQKKGPRFLAARNVNKQTPKNTKQHKQIFTSTDPYTLHAARPTHDTPHNAQLPYCTVVFFSGVFDIVVDFALCTHARFFARVGSVRSVRLGKVSQPKVNVNVPHNDREQSVTALRGTALDVWVIVAAVVI